MKKLALTFLLLLSSCGLFSIDASAAIQLKKDQTQIVLNILENFTEIINNSTGISDAQKQLIILKLSAALNAYEKDDLALIDFFKSIDSENYEEVIAQTKALFAVLKEKYQW